MSRLGRDLWTSDKRLDLTLDLGELLFGTMSPMNRSSGERDQLFRCERMNEPF